MDETMYDIHSLAMYDSLKDYTLFDSQIMLEIFKWLDGKSLASCTEVCKEWFVFLDSQVFVDIEIILSLVREFMGNVQEWRYFLQRTNAVRQIKVSQGVELGIIDLV